jgi:hypothetical protein
MKGPSASKTNVKPDELQPLLRAIGDRLTTTGEEVPRVRDYEGCEVAGHGSLMRRQMDVLVILPGQAMEWCRNNLKLTDAEVCKYFLELDFKCTRLDAAVDTPDERTSPLVVKEHWNKKAVTSTAKYGEPHEPKTEKGQKPSSKGWTFYIGSKKSDRYMRIYDKAAEHAAKTGTTHLDHLTRFEMQSRHDSAHAFAELIAANGLRSIKEVFKGWISFKTLRGRKEVYKRDDVQWWSALVGEDVDFLNVDPRIATPEKTVKWLKSTGILRALKLAQRFGKFEEIQKEIDKIEIPATVLKQWNALLRPEAKQLFNNNPGHERTA